MVKTRILVVWAVASLWGGASSWGQSVEIPEFNDLRTPTGPAFTILGVSPTAIARPLTPGAVGLSFLSSVRNLNELPRDFSLEVAPYWLFPHTKRSWRDDLSRTMIESLQRTTTISIATAKLSSDTTSLAAGLRTSLLSGKSTPQFVQDMSEVEESLAPIAEAIALFFQKNGRSPKKSEIEAIIDSLDIDFNDVDYQRTGWFLDVAVAGIWSFPENVARRGRARGWAVWMTLDREWTHVSVAGVARYQDNELIRADPVGDFGVKLLGMNRDFGGGIEILWRVGKDERPQERITALFEYKLHRGVWLSLTLGEDFDHDRADSFVAQAILNLNFDKNRQVQIGD